MLPLYQVRDSREFRDCDCSGLNSKPAKPSTRPRPKLRLNIPARNEILRFSILHVKVVCKSYRFAIVFVSFSRILLVTVAQTLGLLLLDY